MRLFQAALDTCLDSPFFASLSVHGLHFTVYAPLNECWEVLSLPLCTEFPYIFMAEASFSAYLLAFLRGKNSIVGPFWGKSWGNRKEKNTTKIGRGIFWSKNAIFPSLKHICLKGRQQTRPWPYLYIVSLVVILRNWICHNWVYQLPKPKTMILSLFGQMFITFKILIKIWLDIYAKNWWSVGAGEFSIAFDYLSGGLNVWPVQPTFCLLRSLWGKFQFFWSIVPSFPRTFGFGTERTAVAAIRLCMQMRILTRPEKLGDGPNAVSESTVSNTELS